MKHLEMLGQGQVRWIELPDPEPGPGEVLVRIARSALCGSELHTYRGKGSPGRNAGHEAAGTVAAIGQGVSELAVGQRVGLSGVVGCGVCEHCRAGRYTWCQDRVGGYGPMHAEYVVMPPRGCVPLPDDIGWEAGVLISGDGMGVPYRTSKRLSNPNIETVAIFGVGPIGLGNTIVESYLGRRVLAVDISPQRLAYAQQMGAAETINASDVDPVATIHELTDGHGADVCIEAAGRPQTLRQCLQAVRVAGTVAINGEQPQFDLNPSEDLIRRDITLFGSWFYHFGEWPEMADMVRQGLPAENLITHRFPMTRAQEAWAAFDDAKTGKVLLDYDR